MLEILFLVVLCKRLGAILRAKGRAVAGFQFLLVVAFLAGQLSGAVVAAGVVGAGGGGFPLGMYFGSLIGAACGATAVFLLARSLPEADSRAPSAYPVPDTVPPEYRRPPPGPDPGEL